MMLTFSFFNRRNGSRADWAAGRTTGPEAMISVLEYTQVKCKGDDDSITHPQFKLESSDWDGSLIQTINGKTIEAGSQFRKFSLSLTRA